ncbi:MAG: flavin reductase family protein [Asgard group archaeon]|nr:flavin reductase family protein [Asgard group archaeon]
MTKINIDQRFSCYQMPTIIVGSIKNKKPNFMLCSWASRVNKTPPIWMISLYKERLTLEGIQENKIFTMNFPSTDMVAITDYVGIVSGKVNDKSDIFNIFYGETNVPMIVDCPLNIELTVTDMIELPQQFVVFGEAIKTYITEECCTDGKPDFKKMKLFVYNGNQNQQSYWSLDQKIGDAFKIGHEFIEKINQ